MQIKTIGSQEVKIHCCNTVIVGSGAAGMNCAKKLYEYMELKGIEKPQDRISVVTAGLPLGASRMSGSDKQTYYKMSTSAEVADSAESFAESLTAGGCCHGDLALAEGIGSLRGFYNLVEAGVPFPHDPMGSYMGYKTDHDPYQRATSAGPKTSKLMSECLEKIVRKYGIKIFDHQEAVEFVTRGSGDNKRIAALVTVYKKELSDDNLALNVFAGENFVLAAGGPGSLYERSVYPPGQTGIHGIAFKTGLAGENLTESQFGLASTKFRWNVSGTYMQAIPRIYSTNADGGDEKEFLADFFPTMSKMATNIFLKGYQWPFDSQKIENFQSSLIDVIVFNETQKGRRVFMDFLHNPVGNGNMDEFRIEDLEPEPLDYLKATGAMHKLPIERLEHMNPPAIDIYKEHDIDLYCEPLEIAVCAQHNNGGFGVDKWWQSNIKNTFVIGEMAGTHGVKRPGGSALNAGQVGAQRAAEYIAQNCDNEIFKVSFSEEQNDQLEQIVSKISSLGSGSCELLPEEALKIIRQLMTKHAGYIRKLDNAQQALVEVVELYKKIERAGLKIKNKNQMIAAIQARHLALCAAGFLKAIVELLKADAGSRGSYLIIDDNGIVIHKDVIDPDTGGLLKYKPENEALRKTILKIVYNPACRDLFDCEVIQVRPQPNERKVFELAWTDFRQAGNLSS